MNIESLIILTSQTKEVIMKKIILILAFSTGVSLSHGQEYKLVCERITVCPLINGTCPTCKIVGSGKTREELDAKIDRILEEYKAEIKKKYGSENFKKARNIKPGWEWDGPTWRGLRVLY